MGGDVSLVVLVIGIVVAALVGFAASYVWMRGREARLVASQAELLSLKAEELARIKLEHECALNAKDAVIAECEAAIAEREERVARLEDQLAGLEAELAGTQVTVMLDHYSDFQILGMCDVFDAEQTEGSLRRIIGDPAMEQLSNLGIVDYQMPHDGGRDKTPLWTLKPEWRAAVRACRAEMDARTEKLRARREAKQEA